MSRSVSRDADDVLHDFAAEPQHDPATLAAYLQRYPEHALALIDLSHELRLQSRPENQTGDEPDEAWLQKSWTRLQDAMAASTGPVTDPFAGLAPARFAEMRQTLGVPTAVLNAFRDRLVIASSVPRRFLGRLADALQVTGDALATFLEGPPRLAGAPQFKSDAAPRAPAEKMSFEAVLEDALVSPEKRAALMVEDD